VLLLGLLAGMALARPLNLLAGGELQAAALGVEVKRLRYGIYLLASLLAASAVTLAGSVGFIGLVTPHLVRLMGARDHRLLIPASLLLGGTLLTLADTLSRSLFAPQQLPVGVVTALLGVPLFLYLLQRGNTRA
jgi:iron complex transport system permease protein